MTARVHILSPETDFFVRFVPDEVRGWGGVEGDGGGGATISVLMMTVTHSSIFFFLF